ncbi:MAG: Tad domain-containing protein [Abditibacteriales bacterium]|nr:Tad domain-containing protein [Abditibacteriales bacterium]MDW8365135.1 pilus assembly protein TadG-related protein [Abditibacteriales bacterium]
MRSRKLRGQTLVMVALIIVVLLGCVAFAVDFGHTYSVRQKMRNNVDAAALAGAQSLPTASAAKTAAANYYALNMGLTASNVVVLGHSGNTTQYRIGSDTVDITTPYSDAKTQAKGIPASNAIRVFACRNVRGHFGSLFGLASTQHCLRSIAVLSGSSSGGNAMWANQEIEILGNNNLVTGNTHSNKNLILKGNNNSITGTAFYVVHKEIQGNHNSVTPQQTTTKPMPSVPNSLSYYKALAQANGTYYMGNKTFVGNNLVLKGVIFVDGGDLLIAGNNISGMVTFVTSTGRIGFQGNNFNFTAYVDKLVAYAANPTGQGCSIPNIEVAGNNATFRGTLYAASGSVIIKGNNLMAHGALIGNRQVIVAGNNARVTFDGTYGLGGSNAVSLLE